MGTYFGLKKFTASQSVSDERGAWSVERGFEVQRNWQFTRPNVP